MARIGALGAAVAAAWIAFGVAQAKAVGISASVTPVTHYIWRGADVLCGAKYPVQPSVTATFGSTGLSANVWGSFATADRDSTRGADELDFTVDYERGVLPLVTARMGGVYYYLPRNAPARTAEIYAGVSLAAPLSPGVTVYYDTKWLDGDSASTGVYVLASVEHSASVMGLIPLDLSASLGYGRNDTAKGFQDASLTVATSIPFGRVSLTPFIAGTYIFRDSVNADAYEVCGGLTASIEL